VSKVPIGRIPYLVPIPIVLVGADVDGRPNFATVGDCAVLGLRPALVVVSLGAAHHTTRGVLAHGAFSINVPTESMLPLVDCFGIISGRDRNKATLLPSVPGELTGVPLAVDCPINLECRVRSVTEVEHRRIFIADVVQTHVDERFVTMVDGKASVAAPTALRPILYALDNGYYGVGERIGTGYESGRALASRPADA
jgi:flavin reductase (DIM6/NTAB) family NADH-FMN oxidoreductase RutF